MDKVDLRDYFREYDPVKYKQSGKRYEGYVSDVQKDFINGRFWEVDEYDQKIDIKPFTGIIYHSVMKGLELEWWFDGQGCDNSAIGVSGSWELFCS